MLGVLVILTALQIFFGDDVTHEDLNERLIVLEQEARFQSCLLQTPADDRSPAVIADCVIVPNPSE